MSERGEYRSITKVLLDGPDFQALPEQANHLFLVLKINFGPSGIDVWYPDELVSRLSRQTRMAPDDVRRGLDVLEREEWIKRDQNIVWIVEQLAHDPHTKRANANHRSGVHRHLAGLPHLEIVRDYCEHYKDWFEKTDAIPDGLRWALASPSKGKKRDRKPIEMPSESHADTISDGIPHPISISKSKSKSESKSESNLPDAHASEAKNWVAEATALWRAAIGEVDHGHIGAQLKGAVDHHGWPSVRAAISEYAQATVIRVKSPKFFAADIVRWIAEANTPLVGEGGVLTAKGQRLAGVGT